MSKTKEAFVTRRSPEEQLAELDKKMEQLKARKQQIQTKISQKERKERTRRLIQIGAIFEKQFPKLMDLSLEEVSEAAAGMRELVNKQQNLIENQGG